MFIGNNLYYLVLIQPCRSATTRQAKSISVRHACRTRRVSDTACRVMQLWFHSMVELPPLSVEQLDR